MANIITHIELGDRALVRCRRCGTSFDRNANFYVQCNAMPEHSSGRLWADVLDVVCAPCLAKAMEEAK
jgi:hypothetical protein